MLFLLVRFLDERFVNVRNDTTASDGGLDERIEFLISANGELKMSWGDTLYPVVLRCITSQLEHFSSQILQDGGAIYSRSRPHTSVIGSALLQEAMDSSYGELQTSSGRARGRGFLLSRIRSLLGGHVAVFLGEPKWAGKGKVSLPTAT